MQKKLALLGCGNMGGAIAEALSPSVELHLFDRSFEKSEKLASKVGAKAFSSLEETLHEVSFVFLSIKPKDLASLSDELKRYLKPSQTLISILAGVNLTHLKTYFPQSPLLLIMTNLACRYGKGSVALAQDGSLQPQQIESIESLLHPLGSLHWISATMMDSMTAYIGSGPAFLLNWMEAAIQAGISLGFSNELSFQLAQELLEGTFTLLKESQESPSALKWQITSPAGTTVAGLNAFEAANGRFAIIQAFLAAQARASALKPF